MRVASLNPVDGPRDLLIVFLWEVMAVTTVGTTIPTNNNNSKCSVFEHPYLSNYSSPGFSFVLES